MHNERESQRSKENLRWIKTLLYAATAFLLLLSQDVPIHHTVVHAQLHRTTSGGSYDAAGAGMTSGMRIATAVDWSSQGGYTFDLRKAYIELEYDTQPTGLLLSDSAVVNSSLLCEQAPGSPVCDSISTVVSHFGIPLEAVHEFEHNSVVVAQDNLRDICGPLAAACVTLLGNEFVAVYGELSVGSRRHTHHIVAHELTHQLAGGGIPGDAVLNNDRYAIAGAENVDEDGACVRVHASDISVCSSGANGTTKCDAYYWNEVQAVVASRVYMADYVDSRCRDMGYMAVYGECAGGYSAVFNEENDVPGVLTQEETIRGVNILTQYFVRNPKDFEMWIQGLRTGNMADVFHAISFAYNGIYDSPEKIAVHLGRLNTSLKEYAGLHERNQYTNTVEKPVTAFCSE